MEEKIKEVEKLKPSEFETRWQKIWEEKGVYLPDLANAKKPFYNLMMFPYPSAEGLHVGNMYAFTGADIYGRFQRMKGFDVFEPIGLDGFGIHSENYAIKIGRNPAEQALISEKNFYRQLRASGNGFAWKNKLETYDPDYYRWTQWIFVQMYKHGLAYRKKSGVNFCPSCKTVLADEQVIDGLCERCKTAVEKKEMEQWYFRITKYAEKLLQNTFQEDFHWTNKVKIAQRNWIGKSEGILLQCKVKDLDIHFEMFDSVPQTYMAQTFTVIAPEHPDLYELVKGTKYEKPVMEFVEKIKKKKAAKKFDIDKETEGVFTGRYIEYKAGDRLLPIWVASFVIADYGTGIVNCSAHDERDFIFAKKYDIPLYPVMFPPDPKEAEKVKNLEYCYHHVPEGILTEPEIFKGRKWGQVREDVIDYIENHGWGKRSSQYHLRDWLISRQRYWGAPIPMVYCPTCAKSGKDTSDGGKLSLRSSDSSEVKGSECMPGWYPVPEDQLPVLLPENVKDWKPEGTGKGPLAKIESFINVKCPKCGELAQRETDVCDTFLDSSWYFLRYPSVNKEQKTKNREQEGGKITSGVAGWSGSASHDSPDGGGIRKDLPWDPSITKKWLPVDIYIGGAEHSVLHLLYSRFVTMAFKDFGLLDFTEPYRRFYAHGLIIAEGAKMSKSRGNVIIPDEYIRAYGADTLRTYLMFLGPFDMGGDFRDTGIAGMYRFLNRVWRLVNEHLETSTKNQEQESDKDTSGVARRDSPDGGGTEVITRIIHRTIKEVTDDLENLRYNTAISQIMIFVNALTDNPQLTTHNAIKTLLLLLAPFAPHMTEELWSRIKYQVSGIKYEKENNKEIHNTKYVIRDTNFQSIHLHPWPVYDPKYLVEDEVTIVVQVNGKTRDTIKVKSQKSKVKSEVEEIARKSPKVQKHLSQLDQLDKLDKSSRSAQSSGKVIFIPGKLINFVV